MHSVPTGLNRRAWLKRMAAAGGAMWGMTRPGGLAAAEIARARRCRIVVQYDAQELYGVDFDAWLRFRFQYIDQPGSQIDSVFWDLGRLGQVLYPSTFLDRLAHPGLEKWRRAGIDFAGRLIAETKRRGLEAFWHHRVSEVDMNAQGDGAAWNDGPDPLKRAHPDWVLKTDWWRHGLWNLAVAHVRDYTIRSLGEVAQLYPIDGVQLDFARHVPCLPVGRQWELREHVTELMRAARRMSLDVGRRRGRPLLIAAKVPETLEGCRADGFDVAAWCREQLVDVLTLGSRSSEVNLAAFRRIAPAGTVRLQPCFDDHHTTDGYRYAPIETLQGVFSNWWRQGADAVATFNWSNATPEECRKVGQQPGPPSHQQAYREVGSMATMHRKDKTFFVQRRGGYPWAEGYFNRNETARLPLPLRPGEPVEVPLRLSDDLTAEAAAVASVRLRAVFFRGPDAPDGADEPIPVVRFNGTPLTPFLRDPKWKDPQIFSPNPQPASGGPGNYAIDPRQRLLRVEYQLDPKTCRVGENTVRLQPPDATGQRPARPMVLEKLEVDVRYRV